MQGWTRRRAGLRSLLGLVLGPEAFIPVIDDRVDRGILGRRVEGPQPDRMALVPARQVEHRTVVTRFMFLRPAVPAQDFDVVEEFLEGQKVDSHPWVDDCAVFRSADEL